MNYRRVYIKDSKIFITMVTSKRHPILIENIEILRNSFKQTKQKIVASLLGEGLEIDR